MAPPRPLPSAALFDIALRLTSSHSQRGPYDVERTIWGQILETLNKKGKAGLGQSSSQGPPTAQRTAPLTRSIKIVPRKSPSSIGQMYELLLARIHPRRPKRGTNHSLGQIGDRTTLGEAGQFLLAKGPGDQAWPKCKDHARDRQLSLTPSCTSVDIIQPSTGPEAMSGTHHKCLRKLRDGLRAADTPALVPD